MNSTRAMFSELMLEPDEARFGRFRQRFENAKTQGRKDLVLFGCGHLGKLAARGLKRMGLTPVAFADNNPALAGTVLDGIPVLAPADAATRYRQSAVFIVTVYTNGPVLKQLEELDVFVMSYAELTWCFPDELLPFGSLDRPSVLREEAARIEAARGLWADEASRVEFDAQLRWRATLDRAVLPAHLPHHEIYFPDDLVKVGPTEVVVDCGAFDGDTLRDLLERVPGGVKHYYGVEPDPGNAKRLEASMKAQVPAIAHACTVFPCAVGNANDTLKFMVTGTAGSHLGALGNTDVPVRRLDDLLEGVVPTFLKMDIEGAERSALEGAAGTIGRHLPVLAICLYHKPTDLWDLPLLIRELGPDYRLFLRRYCDECWEMVCYAIPAHRLV